MKKRYEHGEVVLEIDHDKCTGSGECVQACPMNILELEDDRSTCTDITKCISCCACYNACPEEAIEHSICSRQD
ncbi:MAG: 4Fe-4S binding protein [Thermoplasmatota archaeon]